MSFLPTSVAGCVLWLDATDQNTIVRSGTSVSQWSDKSGQGYDFTQAATLNQPTYSSSGLGNRGSIVFDGSTSYIFSSTLGGLFGGEDTPLSLFFVMRFTNHTSPAIQCIFNTYTGTSTNGFHTIYLDNGVAANKWRYLRRDQAVVSAALNSAQNIVSGTTYLHTQVFQGTTVSGYINGTVDTNFNNASLNVGTLGTTNSIAAIGILYRSTQIYFLNGEVGEFLVYQGAVSDFSRQQIEGYLAWKWGLQANLPNTNPYKNSPPTSTVPLLNSYALLLNTSAQAGTLVLPPAIGYPGKQIIVKDRNGTFNQSTLTVSVNSSQETFDGGSVSSFQITKSGWMSLTANQTRWLTTSATQQIAVYTSSMNTNFLSTQSIASQQALLSSFQLLDRNAPSTSQIYSISSLLYFRAGNTSNIISGTRASFGTNLLTFRRPFTPLSISGLDIWLDAADLNTITLTGGNISLWRDKIFARAITPVTANTITLSSLNGLPIVNLGNNRMTSASLAWFSIFTVVIVAKSVNGSFLFSQGATSYDRYVFTGNNSLLRVDQTTILIVADSVIPTGTPVVSNNQYFILIIGRASGGSTGSPYRINGTARTTTTDPDTPASGSTSNPLWLNGNWSGTFDTSEVAEILMFRQVTLSTTQCQQVEGYLAWKWNLTSVLPSTHPFKNVPP